VHKHTLPLNAGPASFKRLLGGGENRSAYCSWEFDEDEELGGIEIVLTGLIDDADLSVLSGISIG